MQLTGPLNQSKKILKECAGLITETSAHKCKKNMKNINIVVTKITSIFIFASECVSGHKQGVL